MFPQLESLIVFANSDNMADAANKLRISQSALSKRIRSLEAHLGYPLIVHRGRKAHLTTSAQQLLDGLEPLVAQITDLLNSNSEPSKITVSIAFADAIMVSWGSTLVAALAAEFPLVEFELHSHRTTTIVERLRRGRYQLGVCTGLVPEQEGLLVTPLVDEPMAVVCKSGGEREFEQWLAGVAELDVCCIEAKSAMWSFLSGHMATWRLRPAVRLESSVGAARLAAEGFAHALVPVGVVSSVSANSRWVTLNSVDVPNGGKSALKRPCSLVSRKHVVNHPHYKEIYRFIERFASDLF